MGQAEENPLRGVRVLDGGLATELEFLGADLSGPLWSAHVLEQQPRLVAAVHEAYLAAGAECIATASYQVSRRGFAELGLPPERADAALLRAVELAVGARDAHLRSAAASLTASSQSGASLRPLVAASLGPFGAALHNGAEYHGNYDCSWDELVEFHRERIAVLATSSGADRADLIAFETVPSLAEAEAIVAALSDWPEVRAWISFTTSLTANSARCVAHGEPLGDCAEVLAAHPQVVGIGLNCLAPRLVLPLIGELRAACELPIVVYPNSGENWDASARCWTGASDPQAFHTLALEWFEAGAQMVGGCCRTRPEHIRQIAAAARGQRA